MVADIETKEGTYEIIKYQSTLRDPKSESGKRRLKVPEIILLEVERRKDRIQLLKKKMPKTQESEVCCHSVPW